jgi:lysozyme
MTAEFLTQWFSQRTSPVPCWIVTFYHLFASLFSPHSHHGDIFMIRHLTQKGIQFIQHFEGFRATPYRCSAGVLTIGYGHAIKKGEDFTAVPLSQEAALTLLRRDVREAEQAVLRLIRIPLTDGQFDALVSFTFNLGSAALQRSTLRSKVNREEHHEAAGEFLKWCWAGGKKSAGLFRRRKAESVLYVRGR